MFISDYCFTDTDVCSRSYQDFIARRGYQLITVHGHAKVSDSSVNLKIFLDQKPSLIWGFCHLFGASA